MADILRLDAISKAYIGGDGNPVSVLQNANLTIKEGELIGLIGPSGAGKSTLLHIAGLLEHADSGQIEICNNPIDKQNDAALSALRLRKIGFIYQFHHLLAEFSALENVMLPQNIAHAPHTQARARAQTLLSSVGLEGRLHHRPAKLSGGEKQRVAFCRAIANRPALLIADEPTGNLDPASAQEVFAKIIDLTRREGLSALIATHDIPLAQKLDRVLTLEQGSLKPV